MIIRRIAVFGAAMLVAAACGGGDAAEETTQAPATTQAATTTTEAATTTTQSPPESTTTTSTTLAVSENLIEVQAAAEQTAANPATRTEGSMEFRATIDGTGSVELTMPFVSLVDLETGNTSMSLDLSAMGGIAGGVAFGTMEMVQVGDVAYMKFPFLGQALGVTTPWMAMPAEDGASLAESFSFGVGGEADEGLLGSLSESGAVVTKIGPDEVRGVTTTHYLVEMDAAALEASGTTDEELQEMLEFGIDTVPIDLWIDDESNIHRMILELEGPFEVEDGGTLDFMKMVFDFSGFGESVTIEAPNQEDVTDVSDQIGAFVG